MSVIARHGRLGGAALVVLAIIAVLVLSTIDGRRVAGSPVALVFAPPPQLGDCVVPPLPPGGEFAAEIPVSQLTFGSCTDDIAGEIVGLLAHVPPPPGTQGSQVDPCFSAAAGFAGLVVLGTLPLPTGDDAVRWMPTIGAKTYRIVPGDLERRAGRAWTACLTTPTLQSPYRGTVRAAHTTGTLPDEYGLCWAGTDLDEMPQLQQCGAPHLAELLATGWIPDRSVVQRSEIDASCLAIASRIMRTDDPTRQGTISIVLDAARQDGASDPSAPLTVNCFAAASGGEQLTHTVIGLADGPVPLAG